MIISSYIIDIKIDNYTLIINGLNGHSDLLETRLWDRIRTNINSVSDIYLINRLIKRKYILKNKSEEKQIYKGVVKKLKNDRMRQLVINLTENCNLSCPYCISSTRRSSKILSRKKIDKIFYIIRTLERKYQFFYKITLFGGETLMLSNRQILEYLLKKLKETKYKLHIVTNGVTINKYIDLIKDNTDKMASFQITLDGPSELHDKTRIGPNYPKTFHLISKNINRLLQLKRKVLIRTNIGEHTLKYLPKLAKYIYKEGWNNDKNFHTFISLIHTYHINSSKCNPIASPTKYIKKLRSLKKIHPELSIYEESTLYNYTEQFLMNILKGKSNIARNANCSTIRSRYLTFSSDNHIYTCFATIGIKDFSVGTFYPKLKWNKKNLQLWENRLSNNMKKCKKCPLVFICGGNCPLDAYEKNKDVNKPVCYGGLKSLEEFVQLNKDEIFKKAGIKRKI